MNKIKEKVFNFKLLITTGIIFIIIALISPFVLAPLIYKAAEKWLGGISNLGPAGDLLGGSTLPFFNIASILLILATIAIQREELTLTRDELKLTRDEFKEQNNTLSIQRFENTFFQMVNLHNNITSSLEFSFTRNGKETGKAVISTALKHLKSKYNTAKPTIFPLNEPISDLKVQALLIRDSYKKLLTSKEGQLENTLGIYYTNLYHILKFIDESDIKNKIIYIRIIRSQLSTDELTLLLYNALSEYASPKMLELLNNYNFLHNIENRSDLMLSEVDYEIYLNYERYIKNNK